MTKQDMYINITLRAGKEMKTKHLIHSMDRIEEVCDLCFQIIKAQTN